MGMSAEYQSLALFLLLCLTLSVGLLGLASVIGPRRHTSQKDEPWETGKSAPAANRRPYSPGFLVFAVLFVVFDMEIAFLYPWAVAFGGLQSVGLGAGLVFLGVLAFGLVYAWHKGALRWD
jgi:NADH-quinone oxidoreductase subunit A